MTIITSRNIQDGISIIHTSRCMQVVIHIKHMVEVTGRGTMATVKAAAHRHSSLHINVLRPRYNYHGWMVEIFEVLRAGGISNLTHQDEVPWTHFHAVYYIFFTFFPRERNTLCILQHYISCIRPLRNRKVHNCSDGTRNFFSRGKFTLTQECRGCALYCRLTKYDFLNVRIFNDIDLYSCSKVFLWDFFFVNDSKSFFLKKPSHSFHCIKSTLRKSN